MQVLLDMSCGSGLFSRRFVQSRRFKGVVAADFSDNMLRQAAQFFSEDRSLSPQYVSLLMLHTAMHTLASAFVRLFSGKAQQYMTCLLACLGALHLCQKRQRAAAHLLLSPVILF